MKALIATLALTLSAVSYAAPSHTSALKTIVEAGTFQGNNCSVTVTYSEDSATVALTAEGITDSFTVLNITPSQNYTVTFNELTNELVGRQKIKFPKYLGGGVKLFSAKLKENGKTLISITTNLYDHKGNDVSTYANCEISK